MAIQRAEAFVLRTQPFRSSSLIITFFSRPFGKLRGLAKGVRREREVRGAVFELFTQVEIIFYEKMRSDLHLVSECSILKSHDNLRTDLGLIAYASYFSELVDAVTEVHDPHEKIYDLLEFSFGFLPAIPPQNLSRLFEIKLLHEIGWLPYLEGCLGCGDTRFEAGFFSVSQGALYCARCSKTAADAKPLTRQGLALMRYYAGHDLETSLKHRAEAADLAALGALMEQFLIYRLGRPLKSRQFMRSIRTVMMKSG